MTTDDVREAAEAAERLRRYKHGDHRAYDKRDEPHEVDLDKVERDRIRVVDAYLALTDPTPLDAEWLKSVGFFQSNESMMRLGRLEIQLPEGCATLDTDDYERDWAHLPEQKTRGAVRLLAAGLGIDLREAKGGEG